MRASMILVLGSLATNGCAATPGARPQDMGVAEHQAMAASADKVAAAHAAQHQAAEPDDGDDCGRPFAVGATEPIGHVCWSRDPTLQHLEEVKKLRQMAADHRAASQALKDAETRACGGLSERDRDISPFAHREDIVSVQPAGNRLPTGGAIITFRAVPGMTAQWLQRVIDCHLARNASLGNVAPEMPWCPLVPRGATARVTATDAGFAVWVGADDSEVAAEILRRARLLVAR